MREIGYKNFSWRTHQKNWSLKRPNVCQFELTFKCALHCEHCYSDCYNGSQFIKKELNTKQAKTIIDKAHALGVLWLCFTGGDPLQREDFLDIYDYAKKKGFIITVFTTGFSMTEKIAGHFKKTPPFVIEITINAVTKNTCERITKVQGSFEKTMRGLDIITSRNLPLKVKTMVTSQNYEEIHDIKLFLQRRGIEFRPSLILYARLNGDTTPCSLRLRRSRIKDMCKLFGNYGKENLGDGIEITDACRPNRKSIELANGLFRCVIGGGDGINIDPYGNMFPCTCIREPKINFLNSSIAQIKHMLHDTIASFSLLGYKAGSKCLLCKFIDKCPRCPGQAFLETGSMEKPIQYYCDLVQPKKIKKNGNKQI
jgi:radical SAM protein with 4Fe4S-binding SPASM domain